MKILTLGLWPINNTSIGGTERFIIDFSKAVMEQKIKTTVLTISGGSKTIDNISCKSINLEKTFQDLDEYSLRKMFFNPFSEKNIISFCSEIEKNIPKDWDVLHFTSLLFSGISPGKNKIFTLHTLPSEFDQMFGKGSFKKMSSFVRKNTTEKDIFIAPCEHYTSLFEQYFKRRVFSIPHAIDKKRLTTPISKKDIRSNFNLPKKSIILNPARLEITQKRQDLIIEALGSIKNNLEDFHLVFTGVDKQYIKNVNLLKKMAFGCSISISFLAPPMDDISQLYKVADVVVLPSKYESFGYAAIESLSLGVNTVLPDIPPFLEIAKDHPCAHIWKEKETSLRDVILNALKSNKKRIVPSCWAERYSPKKWSQQYIDIIKNHL